MLMPTTDTHGLFEDPKAQPRQLLRTDLYSDFTVNSAVLYIESFTLVFTCCWAVNDLPNYLTNVNFLLGFT
jgi:hypothetical protein